MRVPEFLTDLTDAALGTLSGLITKPRVVREAELLVDLAICLALAVIPGKVGWIACVAFFLLRDAALTGMQSPGKSLYNLKVVSASTGAVIGWRTSVVRNVVLIVPVLNIVDILHFVRHGRRLTDEWLGLDVRQEKAEKDVEEEADDNHNPPTTE